MSPRQGLHNIPKKPDHRSMERKPGQFQHRRNEPSPATNRLSTRNKGLRRRRALSCIQSRISIFTPPPLPDHAADFATGNPRTHDNLFAVERNWPARAPLGWDVLLGEQPLQLFFRTSVYRPEAVAGTPVADS